MEILTVDFNRTVQALHFGREHLIPPRQHVARVCPEHVLYAVTDGHLPLMVDGAPEALRPGDVAIFPRTTRQAPIGTADCAYFYLHFDGDCTFAPADAKTYAADVQRDCTDFARASAYGAPRYGLLRARVPCRMHLDPGGRDWARLTAMLDGAIPLFTGIRVENRVAALHAVSELFLLLQSAAAQTGAPSARAALALNVAAYVERHYAAPLDGRCIARECGRSYDYVNRVFRAVMGESILRYRDRLRMDRAKSLLRTTTRSLADVAAESGFPDVCYFSRVFKKMTGQSPMQFRVCEAPDAVRKEPL